MYSFAEVRPWSNVSSSKFYGLGAWFRLILRIYANHDYVISSKYDSLSRCGWPSDRRWAWRRWSGRRPACPWRSGTAGTAAGAPRCGQTPTAADQSESGYTCWLPNKTRLRVKIRTFLPLSYYLHTHLEINWNFLLARAIILYDKNPDMI